MDWYYAEGQQQRGPVSEAELEGLVKAGTVGSDTLVWREGMENWQAYGQVKGAAPTGAAGLPVAGAIVCSQCGRAFAHDEVIRYGELWVCAACKPIYLQRLKEGAALSGVTEYAGFWIRFVAKFVDGLILRFAGIFINLAGAAVVRLLGDSAAAAVGFLMVGFAFLVDILYRAIFVGAFGGTPGKMAVKVRIVNADGSKVGYGKAFARALAEYLSMIIFLIGYFMAAFDDEKRTLHDRICGTRVIKKQA